MSTVPNNIIKRVRKPKPRHPEVILAAIDERLKCLPDTDANQFHVPRLKELLEELARSISGKFDEEAE